MACAITDAACIKKAHDNGKPVKVTDKDGKPVPSADSAAAVKSAVEGAPPPSHAPAPRARAWFSHDFVDPRFEISVEKSVNTE